MKTPISFVLLLMVALLFSCNENSVIDLDTEKELAIEKSSTIAVNEIMMESAIEEGQYEAGFYSETEALLKKIARVNGRHNKLVNWNNSMRYKEGQCPNVSINPTDSVNYPVTITLDYGAETVLKNGRILSGMITIEISAPKRTDGATRTITYTNYSVDSVTVNGVVSEVFNVAENIDKVLSGKLVFILADGTTIEREESKTHKWLSGLDTPLDHSDNQLEVTGVVNATASSGESYKKEITKPLIKTGECRHFVQGEVTVYQNNELLFVLDFGNGECDNQATLTTQGETITIDLKDKKPKPERKKGDK
jgi:hypothetical protein